MRTGDAPLLVFFGHHRCGTTSTTGINRSVAHELGLRHEVLTKLPEDQNPREWLDQRGIDFLSYTNARPELVPELGEVRGFHMIRDPRDLCVSQYFSDLLSHGLDPGWADLPKRRRTLEGLNKEEGLLFEIETLDWLFWRMLNWDYEQPHVFELRLEDIMQNPYAAFLEVFAFLGLVDPDAVGLRSRLSADVRTIVRRALPWRGRPRRLTPEALFGVVYQFSFARLTGRRPGDEDVNEHHRKGEAGDWRNHFGPVHVDAFKQRYNEVLVRLGYETDDRWSAEPVDVGS